MTREELRKALALASEIEKLEDELEALDSMGSAVELTVQGTHNYLRVQDASIAEEIRETVKEYLEAKLKETLRQFEAL